MTAQLPKGYHQFKYPDEAHARMELRERNFIRFVQSALKTGRTTKCNHRLHAMVPGGCKNDGSSCICWCHD